MRNLDKFTELANAEFNKAAGGGMKADNKPKNEEKPVKKEVKKEVKEEKKEEERMALFDMSDERLIYPGRSKGGSERGKQTTIYFTEEENNILDKLAEKHRMSKNMVVRMLVLNAK